MKVLRSFLRVFKVLFGGRGEQEGRAGRRGMDGQLLGLRTGLPVAGTRRGGAGDHRCSPGSRGCRASPWATPATSGVHGTALFLAASQIVKI